MLKMSFLDTMLGSMLVVSNNYGIYLLDFVEPENKYIIDCKLESFKHKTKSEIVQGTTSVSQLLKAELKAYCRGSLQKFTTPVYLSGSQFQISAWQALMCVPYGKTISYKEQAKAIGKATAYRAVANANGANNIAIIIPCHRIINSNGSIGGYGGGVERKRWLIEHEKKFNNKINYGQG